MKCMSCEAEIPSKWQACIVNNLCPQCGGVIMDSNTKVLLDELHNVMTKLEASPEGVMDLLLSNYNLKKFSEKEVESGVDITSGLKMAESPVQDFLRRTASPHLAQRRDKIKDILGRISQSDDGHEEYEPEYDPEVPMMTQTEMLQNNSLVSGGPPPTVQEKDQLQTMFGEEEPEVDQSLHPALQKDRLKRLAQSRGVASGGGDGGFRRSG